MATPNLFNLSGKVALVTGASRGIGESIAKTLAAYGAHVIVSSRKVDACESVVAAIRASGGSAEARACHIGEMAQIEALFAEVEAAHGRLDILINNAAANPYYGAIVDTDLSAFQKTIDVNIRGYFFMSSFGVKLMAKNGGGSIVNVASINGVTPGALQGIYSITNALLPGATDTKFASALVNNPAFLENFLKRIPLNRVAEPDEMAGAVLYLASDAASYTTGTCINVDGGYLAS